MRIVIDDKVPFIKGVLEPFAEVVYLPGSYIKRRVVKDCDALIVRTRTECNKELLEGSKVKFIATATIGYDHIDTKWCETNRIVWANAAGCNSLSVQQYLASALVYLAKKYKFKFEDRTLGIVGVGNVGKKVLRLAETLGMRIVSNDPPIMRRRGPCGYLSLEGLIHEADIITLHVPLYLEGQDKTFHLIDEKKLKQINPGTILINTSRGEIVDSFSLINAIKAGILKSSVMDVWENEPDIDLELLLMQDIATPHIAGYSIDGKANGTALSVRALSRFFKFGLDYWFPTNLPSLESSVLSIDATKKTLQDVLCEAIESTFKVQEDDERLRISPHDFENQRSEYPVRREFQEYSVELKNGNMEMAEKLRELGFKVLTL